jgi:tetrahydromethanopterin S-methyltransferase subunit A
MLTMLEKESLSPMSPEDSPTPREGQLSLLGDFPVHQFRKPVAICTLTDDVLREELSRLEALNDVLVGSLHTENLGIEHLITYCLRNPNIRFIIVCGEDGRQAIGHLPGQSFLALAQNGVDERGTIIGAEGKRPVIQNISAEAVEHFRRNVEVIDLIDCRDIPRILETVQTCIARSPGLAEPFEGELSLAEQPVVTLQGYLPDRLKCDPSGYFVIAIDPQREIIILEHYSNQGKLGTIIEGKSGPEIYHPAIECGLLSRLDHASYLGRELERAEQALKTGQPYVQDAGR